MISDEEVGRAIDYLRDSSEKAAQARANVVYLESYLRVVRSEEMALHPELPVSAQERDALASKRYKETLEAYREAVRLDNQFRFLREAADAKIRAWQTFSSNERATRI